MQITLERKDDGTVLLNSRGVSTSIVEVMLLAALAGVQRELAARRTLELVRTQAVSIELPADLERFRSAGGG